MLKVLADYETVIRQCSFTMRWSFHVKQCEEIIYRSGIKFLDWGSALDELEKYMDGKSYTIRKSPCSEDQLKSYFYRVWCRPKNITKWPYKPSNLG